MQFLLLILTNLFIGTLLYLLISLKLEKKSSEYQEKKFRKEMDEIIREFNSTADRNISLLENKIEILKRLLERSGQLKSVDFTVGELKTVSEPMEIVNTKENRSFDKKDYSDFVEIQQENNIVKNNKIKKSLLIFIKKVTSIYRDFKGLNEKIRIDPPEIYENNDLIEIDYQKIKSKESKESKIEQINNQVEELTEDEIDKIVSSSDDMYSLVTRLFDKGCSVENISKHSGLPVGEIKLVLNLNNAR